MILNPFLFHNHFQKIIFYLWRISLSAQNQVGLLYKFSLQQNYQNPFDLTTKREYSVPHTSKVVIKVNDILRNEIEILVNEEKPAGTYKITWNAVNLPSGVYFYRLQAGDIVTTIKSIHLK